MKTNLIKKIVLDPFCFRQFDKTKSKFFINYDQTAFVDKINSFYIDNTNVLKDGYAPFCKHIFIPNFIDTPSGYVPITIENENLIKSCYEARTEQELAVLRRYIPIETIQSFTPAKFLDIILYSKEQIVKENLAMGNTDPNFDIEYEYGIISVKPQDCDFELPMDPITMMRNALGVEHGGSGVPLDKAKYNESVEFWSKNVLLK
jgi:hypothetical protein